MERIAKSRISERSKKTREKKQRLGGGKKKPSDRPGKRGGFKKTPDVVSKRKKTRKMGPKKI